MYVERESGTKTLKREKREGRQKEREGDIRTLVVVSEGVELFER